MGLQKLMSEQKKASIDKEHQAVGAVSSGAYMTYLRSVHSKCLIILFLVVQMLKIAFNALLTQSLGFWADSSLPGQHDHYMQQYGTYLFFNAISSTKFYDSQMYYLLQQNCNLLHNFSRNFDPTYRVLYL